MLEEILYNQINRSESTCPRLVPGGGKAWTVMYCVCFHRTLPPVFPLTDLTCPVDWETLTLAGPIIIVPPTRQQLIALGKERKTHSVDSYRLKMGGRNLFLLAYDTGIL